MTTSIYKSKAVGYFLITYISLLLMWKVLITLAYADVFALLPLTLQFIVIALLVIEHPLARLVLSAWVIFFVLIAQSISIIAKLLASANGNLSYLTSSSFAFNIFQFSVGCFMLYLCKNHIRE